MTETPDWGCGICGHVEAKQDRAEDAWWDACLEHYKQAHPDAVMSA
jgi:hypothetical protein